MSTTAWPHKPTDEFITFEHDGWTILRVPAGDSTPLAYELTHPDLPGDVFVVPSLGEAGALIDSERAS